MKLHPQPTGQLARFPQCRAARSQLAPLDEKLAKGGQPLRKLDLVTTLAQKRHRTL